MDSLAFSPRSENYSLYFEVMKFSLQRFDENGNGILDGQETNRFQEEYGFDLEWDSWTDSQIDGDNNTATKAELV